MVKLLDEKTEGVYSIAVTPFSDDGAIDYSSIDRLVDFYLTAGVSGITVLGVMGEATKLTAAESVNVLTHFLTTVRGRIPVVVGVSNADIGSLSRLALSAMRAGAAGVMVAPAVGLKGDGEILAYFRTVCESVGPDVPVCFQDHPQSTGVEVSAEGLIRLVETQPQVVMLKLEGWPGLNKISDVRALSKQRSTRRVSILAGNGGLFLPQELTRGADGAMTGFAYPEMLVEVVKRFKAGDGEGAENLFDAYLPLVRYENQPGIGLAVRKEIFRRRGAIKFGKARTPGASLTDLDLAETTRLTKRLEARLAAFAR